MSGIDDIRKSRQLSLFLAVCVLLLASTCSRFEDQEMDESVEEADYHAEGAEEYAIQHTPGTAWYASGCDLSQYTPVIDFEVHPVPVRDEPAPREPFMDPVFGTCVVRVTDRDADLLPGDESGGMKNEYSRVQSFNADETLLIAMTTESNWYIYDANSLEPLGQIPVWVEPRWDAEDPDLLYYNEDTLLMSYRISTGQQEIVHDFVTDFPGQELTAVWTRYEGSPSADGRYWGLMAQDEDWMAIALLIYDRQTDQVIAKREVPPSDIDTVTISPLGNYLLSYDDNYCDEGQLGTDSHPCGLMVYDRNLENGRGLVRIIGHSDVAVDVQGNEVLVYQDIDTDYISMVDLATGTVTPLMEIDFTYSATGVHFSGQAFQQPGWVLVSTHCGTVPSSTWMDDQIFAIELKENGRIVRLAHTHSVFTEEVEHDYWAEPHASVNHDFTRIVFTSNWGRTGTDLVDMYMVRLPADWIGMLP